MSTTMLESPMLTGVRSDARRFIENAQVPTDLSGIEVFLDGHNTLAATKSFADELVRILLVDRKAAALIVSVAGDEFTRWIEEAAKTHNVADRIKRDE